MVVSLLNDFIQPGRQVIGPVRIEPSFDDKLYGFACLSLFDVHGKLSGWPSPYRLEPNATL
jgi:hypothetical protein